MSEELGLSDEQRAQVKELMANSAERKASRDEDRPHGCEAISWAVCPYHRP
jgi:hypothetical protein